MTNLPAQLCRLRKRQQDVELKSDDNGPCRITRAWALSLRAVPDNTGWAASLRAVPDNTG